MLQKVLDRLGDRIMNSEKGVKFRRFYDSFLNPVTLCQYLFYKKIPIIINNYNQLDNLLLLIKKLKKRGYHNLYIVDNNSTYKPLLQFYNSTEIKVFRLETNVGHRAFWREKSIYNKFNKKYFVVTDPDVILSDDCPPNILKTFIKVLRNYPSITKAGCALRIDDIPDYYPLKQNVMEWEQEFWAQEAFPGAYYAKIDTTFALYRPNLNHESNFFSGIRLAGPYTATHRGWYTDPSNLTEEELFYKKTANESSSWVLDENENPRASTLIYINKEE